MIEMGKKYQTRDGQKVRVLCVDAGGEGTSYPVVALIGEDYTAENFSLTGEYSFGVANKLDLIEVKEKRTVTFWVNCYADYRGIHKTLEMARQHATKNCLAIKKITFEYFEGEGLKEGGDA